RRCRRGCDHPPERRSRSPRTGLGQGRRREHHPRRPPRRFLPGRRLPHLRHPLIGSDWIDRAGPAPHGITIIPGAARIDSQQTATSPPLRFHPALDTRLEHRYHTLTKVRRTEGSNSPGEATDVLEWGWLRARSAGRRRLEGPGPGLSPVVVAAARALPGVA